MAPIVLSHNRDRRHGERGLNIKGEMAEWSNAAVSKTVFRLSAERGFESPSLRNEGLLPDASGGRDFLFRRFPNQACLSEERCETKK